MSPTAAVASLRTLLPRTRRTHHAPADGLTPFATTIVGHRDGVSRRALSSAVGRILSSPGPVAPLGTAKCPEGLTVRRLAHRRSRLLVIVDPPPGPSPAALRSSVRSPGTVPEIAPSVGSAVNVSPLGQDPEWTFETISTRGWSTNGRSAIPDLSTNIGSPLRSVEKPLGLLRRAHGMLAPCRTCQLWSWCGTGTILAGAQQGRWGGAAHRSDDPAQGG